MYLSKLVLNQRNRGVQYALADCQRLHQTLMHAFPTSLSDSSEQVDARILYRVELRRNGQIYLYVQSGLFPDWSKLGDSWLIKLPEAENPVCKEISGLLTKISPGRALAFSLRANPTRKIESTTKADRIGGVAKNNGKRVFISGEEEQIAWLERKAAGGGFDLLSSNVNETSEHYYGKRKVGNEIKGLTFGGVDFQGFLRIRDADLFRVTLENGIGPGKAYGFGLLVIAPAV